MKTTDPRFDLIRRCVDGDVSEEQFGEMEGLLRDDPEFRLDYLSYLNIDSALGELPLLPGGISPPPRRVAFPRPFASAAVGVVIGLVCASVTWAIALPRDPGARRVMPVLEESFENRSPVLISGFPVRTDVWGGPCVLVSAGPEHPAVDGKSLLRIDPSPETTLSHVQTILGVEQFPVAGEGEVRTLEVATCFLADTTGSRERYTLRLATFGESPEQIHELWDSVRWRKMGSLTLTTTKVGLSTPEDATGWQTVRGAINIPAGTRTIVISLAAGRLDPLSKKTPHYIDDIRAHLLIGAPTKRARRKRYRKPRS